MVDDESFMKRRPHLGGARRLQDGQMIHSSANLPGGTYIPKAVLATTGKKPEWDKVFRSQEDQVLSVEKDLLDVVLEAVEQFLKGVEGVDTWQEVERWLELGEPTAL